MEQPSPSGTSFPQQKPWAKIGIGVAILAALAVVLIQYGAAIQESLQTALSFIQDLGPLGPLLFIGLYVVVTVLFLPASLLTIGGGLIFGPFLGFLYVLVGATIGANVAFLIGRYLARERVAKLIEGNKAFVAIDKAIAQGGWKIVGLIRLSPAFPFNVLNYALGLTRVSFIDNIIGTMGIIPGAFAYAYLGSLSESLIQVAGEMATEDAPVDSTQTFITWTLRIIGLIATFAVTIYVTKVARKALRDTVEEESPADAAVDAGAI